MSEWWESKKKVSKRECAVQQEVQGEKEPLKKGGVGMKEGKKIRGMRGKREIQLCSWVWECGVRALLEEEALGRTQLKGIVGIYTGLVECLMLSYRHTHNQSYTEHSQYICYDFNTCFVLYTC